jgi:hypothetical protein
VCNECVTLLHSSHRSCSDLHLSVYPNTTFLHLPPSRRFLETANNLHRQQRLEEWHGVAVKGGFQAISCAMNKQHILDEIRRTAKANKGVALGSVRFRRESGIKEWEWGKFWARWSEAVREAGFSPNQMQTAFSDDLLFEKFIGLIRELGHFPVQGELRLKSRNDPEFPGSKAFTRLGLTKILEFCQKHGGYDDVVELCSDRLSRKEQSSNKKEEAAASEQLGFVYLLKSGRNYKIGMTKAIGRREYEMAIQLPDKPKTVHVIKTDDPIGIETYWHKRFDAKRKGGEWFELNSADVKAFMRRKFM